MGKDGFLSFDRWFFESIDIVPQERGIHADGSGELGDVDFLVGQEELLHRRRLGIFIDETLETDPGIPLVIDPPLLFFSSDTQMQAVGI